MTPIDALRLSFRLYERSVSITEALAYLVECVGGSEEELSRARSGVRYAVQQCITQLHVIVTATDLAGVMRDSVGQLPLVALGPDSTIKTGGVG